MKKIIAIAAAFTMAACGGNEAEAPVEAEVETAPTLAVSEYAGTYSGTSEDGSSWASTLAADGTFEDTQDGEVVRVGTWTDGADGLCFNVEGETAPECYEMGEIQADGTVESTGPDGETFIMNKSS